MYKESFIINRNTLLHVLLTACNPNVTVTRSSPWRRPSRVETCRSVLRLMIKLSLCILLVISVFEDSHIYFEDPIPLRAQWIKADVLMRVTSVVKGYTGYGVLMLDCQVCGLCIYDLVFNKEHCVSSTKSATVIIRKGGEAYTHLCPSERSILSRE
jgi:hypothetical protein